MTPSPRGPLRARASLCALCLGLLAFAPRSASGQAADAGTAPDLATPSLATPSLATPSVPGPSSFTYQLRRTVSEGTGTYEGYQDSLLASGRYDVEAAEGQLSIHAVYRWRYQGERCEDGAEDRRAIVALADRLYRGPTDLDDYDESPADVPLGVWLWVPPTAQTGEVIRILEHDFSVRAGESLELGGAVVPAIVAQTHGETERHDAYGRFHVAFTDTYWFDAATGYFLRSEHTELDDNDEAGFELREVTAVTSATYLPAALHTPHHDVGRCARPRRERSFFDRNRQAIKGTAAVVGFLVLFYVLYRIMRPRRAPRPTVDGREIEVTRATRPEDVPADAALGSGPLAPFVPHLVRVALRAREDVFVARAAGRVVGVGIADDAGRTAAIFAPHPDVCEQLRLALGVTEHFTEHRHETLPSVVAAARTANDTAPTPAYNLLETWTVLDRDASSPPGYDATRVTRAGEDDLAALTELSFAITQLRREAYRKALLDEGAVLLVARVEGRIVGSVALDVDGDRARLCALGVHPDARGRGLGAELVRAAIAHAKPLGAVRIVTEVAPDAVGARALLEAEGFRAKADLYLESAAQVRPTRKVPWR